MTDWSILPTSIESGHFSVEDVFFEGLAVTQVLYACAFAGTGLLVLLVGRAKGSLVVRVLLKVVRLIENSTI